SRSVLSRRSHFVSMMAMTPPRLCRTHLTLRLRNRKPALRWQQPVIDRGNPSRACYSRSLKRCARRSRAPRADRARCGSGGRMPIQVITPPGSAFRVAWSHRSPLRRSLRSIDVAELLFDAIERQRLCDLLDELGPRAPTLLGPWTTQDLAAHLVLREHD